jgi:hypothetical protein
MRIAGLPQPALSRSYVARGERVLQTWWGCGWVEQSWLDGVSKIGGEGGSARQTDDSAPEPASCLPQPSQEMLLSRLSIAWPPHACCRPCELTDISTGDPYFQYLGECHAYNLSANANIHCDQGGLGGMSDYKIWHCCDAICDGKPSCIIFSSSLRARIVLR